MSLSSQDYIRAWLASWDFIDNPFATWEAGREPWLDRYFIRRPFYEQLLHDLKSTLIFAPRGGGKTATRIMVEAECRPTLASGSILAVSYTDFSPFIESYPQLTRLTLADYLPHLSEAILKNLLGALAGNAAHLITLDAEMLGELRYWLDRYLPHVFLHPQLLDLLGKVQPGMNDAQKSLIATNIQRGESPSEGIPAHTRAFVQFLSRLVSTPSIIPKIALDSPSRIIQAVVNLGLILLNSGPVACRGVYLLIDDVDEYALTQNDPSASLELLYPLLANLHFLELPGLAIKFFLPAEQRAAFEHAARVDRLDVVTLKWEPPKIAYEMYDLRELLRRRIAAFNRRGLVGLGELCAPVMRQWLEDAMLEEARDSPRNLMRLGNLLFAEHCRDLPESESVLLPIEWERALERFRATVHHEQVDQQRAALASPELPTVPVAPGIPRLHVDLPTGRVFRGGEELAAPADLEYRLLAHLYRHRGQVCSKDEITQAVYEPKHTRKDAGTPVGVSDEAISRLIYRLRQRIEPTPPAEPVYLITIKGRGYRLDNTE